MSYRLLRPLLFALEPERAHAVTLGALELAAALRLTRLALPAPPSAPVQVMGLSFPNPIGLAAGLDKNGAHIDALASLGFGFIEVGTVTPRPQPGNARPRLFRIPQAAALINRMGFNNLGVDRLVRNASARQWRGVLGVNLGKNFDTPLKGAAEDYVAGMRKAHGIADYLVVNISSPNTKDLRRLQGADELARLLATLRTEQDALTRASDRRVPLAVKIAPDLTTPQLREITNLLIEHRIDAVIATNTTVSRVGVEGLEHAEEAGGMSGGALRERSTEVVRELHAALAGRIPIIAVGGILRAEDAREKFAAGASLVQLYTGLIYGGPRLVFDCASMARAHQVHVQQPAALI
ncbi:MAG: quinone-dependent dihydroorotate dehydrogenase [Proteobacteria bacterium]|nr:MAG: quinone-dependent dihydroorotate dehydrogenase [Pseudomonadota bacterium]